MNKKLLYLSIALGGATHGAYMSFIPIFVKNEFGIFIIIILKFQEKFNASENNVLN